ncbi:MAG: tetratricopeptide repeat protein [Candidatus Sulfotelmatobacter sp.]|jgi:tetratricopeptide (TPR) repeat protein
MRSWLLVLLLVSSVGAWAQSSDPSNSAPANSQTPDSASSPASKPAPPPPNMAPPRSDRVNADELGDDPGESSSKADPVDLSPPANDAKAHPQGSDILTDEGSSGSGDINEFHPWDPHKAAKDVEVGDFYFKVKKNYRAAEDRYREALLYKPNDATATFHLAQCLEKLDQPDEARKEYASYLTILPHGSEEKEARKAIQRLKGTAANAKPER